MSIELKQVGKAWLAMGDCFEVLKDFPDDYVDSVVTDPPYGLNFMGKHWDHGVPASDVWAEVLRVAKPGAHLLAFGGTRMFHRMAVAIEDAGWEIRDCIMWVYGSGFPKSLDVSKAIDKAAGAKREMVRTPMTPHSTAGKGLSNELDERPWMTKARVQGYHEHEGPNPATDAAKQWQGWGTALKPAWEPIIVARKPLAGTVAANVQQYGTGGLNIDGCRVSVNDAAYAKNCSGDRGHADNRSRDMEFGMGCGKASDLGRWPANFIHDGSEEVVGLFPNSKGQNGKVSDKQRTKTNAYGDVSDNGKEYEPRKDSGSAARFFYCAKASKADRGVDNNHPTVKPTDLMRYLCRLVTPPNGIVLDPFMGSGSTGKAAMLEGFEFLGIDLDPEYVAIAEARISAASKEPKE